MQIVDIIEHSDIVVLPGARARNDPEFQAFMAAAMKKPRRKLGEPCPTRPDSASR
jgi:hypothetical protein